MRYLLSFARRPQEHVIIEKKRTTSIIVVCLYIKQFTQSIMLFM